MTRKVSANMTQSVEGLESLRQHVAEFNNTVCEANEVPEISYRDTLDAMLEGCQVIDPDWRYLYVNDAAARHGRRAREELLGHTMMEMYPGIEKTAMFAELHRCMETRSSHPMENEFIFPDGRKGWFELSIEPVPEGVLILSWDITQRKREEERITHLNSVLWTLRDVNQLITHEKDRERLILKSCDLIMRTRGFLFVWILLLDDKKGYVSAAVAGGKERQDFLNQLRQGNYPPCVDRILDHEKSLICEDIVEERPDCLPGGSCSDGGGLTCRLECEGKIHGVISACMPSGMAYDLEAQNLFQELACDIAYALASIEKDKERLRLEKHLQESETKYAALVEQGNDGIIIIKDGLVRFANRKMVELTGFSLKEAAGKSFIEFVSPEYREAVIEHYQKRMVGEGVPNKHEIEILAKNGKKIPVEINASRIEYERQPADMAIVRDITERKKAEKALIESEERHRALFENARDGIVLYDAETGAVVDCNEEFERETGRKLADLSNLTMWELRPPGLVEPIRQLFNEVRQHGQVGPLESAYERPNGEVVPVEYSARLTMVQGKQYIQSIARDITRRKQAEEALIQSEEKCRAIFEAATDGILLADLETSKFFTGNRAICQMLGYTQEEITNIGVADIHPAEDLPRVVEAFEGQARGAITLSLDIPMKRKDSSVFYADVNSAPVTLAGKTYLAGMFRDATERRQMEEELRKLSSAVEQSPSIVMITDTRGNIEYVNPKFIQLTGYTKQEVIGTHTSALGAPSPGETEQMWQTITAGRKWHGEFPNRKKDGELYWESASISAIRDQNGVITHFVKVAEDITEHKQVEVERRQDIEKHIRAMEATIEAMAMTVEMRDMYTSGHQRRVSELAARIARELKLSEAEINGIRMAGIVHDIGKLQVPAEILSKPGRLTELEFSMIKNHPSAGYDILKNIEFPWPVARIVLQHHERMNGSGYPSSTAGNEILLEAKILGVADVVEAMASHRPYRPALGIDRALEEISQNRGILYDAAVVDACVKLFREKGFKLE